MSYIKGTIFSHMTEFPESIDEQIESDNPVKVINKYIEQIEVMAQTFTFASVQNGWLQYDSETLLCNASRCQDRNLSDLSYLLSSLGRRIKSRL